MGDNWIEISSRAGDHTTFAMSAPGGALIRHVEFSEDGITISVSICFVPSADGSPLHSGQFQFPG
jgi:hypothetical protein